MFRLYYTSECEDQQTIDVYFEDNHDQLYQLTFTFNNEAKEEEDTTEGNTITPIVGPLLRGIIMFPFLSSVLVWDTPQNRQRRFI